MSEDIKVGDKFWVKDKNRRVYEDGKCIYEKHFREVEVIDETSRSWVIGRGHNEDMETALQLDKVARKMNLALSGDNDIEYVRKDSLLDALAKSGEYDITITVKDKL